MEKIKKKIHRYVNFEDKESIDKLDGMLDELYEKGKKDRE